MDWQAAKQKRIGITSSMLDSIKNIKMMGMANTIMGRIQEFRLAEIAQGNRFRWMIVYMNMIGESTLSGHDASRFQSIFAKY
jgi:ATP-binding cassette, subfamily C (CFTR/MRP), member 1